MPWKITISCTKSAWNLLYFRNLLPSSSYVQNKVRETLSRPPGWRIGCTNGVAMRMTTLCLCVCMSLGKLCPLFSSFIELVSPSYLNELCERASIAWEERKKSDRDQSGTLPSKHSGRAGSSVWKSSAVKICSIQACFWNTVSKTRDKENGSPPQSTAPRRPKPL